MPYVMVTTILTRNLHSTETTYQGTVIIPYVMGISEKFKCTANWFNVGSIFKTDENWTYYSSPTDEAVCLEHSM
jgi:hypothetical protein